MDEITKAKQLQGDSKAAENSTHGQPINNEIGMTRNQLESPEMQQRLMEVASIVMETRF